MTVEPLHIPNKKFSNDASVKTYIIAMQIENKFHLGLQNRC
jgi:hypothetical protein